VLCSPRPVTAGPNANAAHASDVVKKPPQRKQKVEPPALGRETARRAERDEPAADGVQRHQDQPQFGQVVPVPPNRFREEEHECDAEQGDERDAPEEALEFALGVRLSHRPRYRHNPAVA
jgi:hypothetical protein